jgi:hypothetical protein
MLQEVTPLKYPPVLFDSSQIDQAGTRLKLCTSSPLNDESSFMLCSLANTWVEAPTLNTSETQQLHCFCTFPFRLGTNGPISEELETQRVSVMGLRPCPRVSSDNQPLAVRYRMTTDEFTHRFTHVHSSDIDSRIHYDTVPDDPVSISHLMAVRT